VDPLLEKAVRAGGQWLFVSFAGDVHPVDVSASGLGFAPTWPLADAAERAAGWLAGGLQPFAVHASSGRLYALVHQGAKDAHDPGQEVWIYDLEDEAARAEDRSASPRPRSRSARTTRRCSTPPFLGAGARGLRRAQGEAAHDRERASWPGLLQPIAGGASEPHRRAHQSAARGLARAPRGARCSACSGGCSSAAPRCRSAGLARGAPPVGEPSGSGSVDDPESCDYWRYCAIDRYSVLVLRRQREQLSAGTVPAPMTWVGTREPGRRKAYVVSYNDCCGQASCGHCMCNRNEGDRPPYLPWVSNDINWCLGRDNKIAYHCSTAVLVGVADK
jgi:methylamine dehydrogenase light chain